MLNLLLMLKSCVLIALIATAGTWSCGAAFVSFEAESGRLGADFTNGSSGAVQFISISADKINNGNPGTASRVLPTSINASSVFYRLIK